MEIRPCLPAFIESEGSPAKQLALAYIFRMITHKVMNIRPAVLKCCSLHVIEFLGDLSVEHLLPTVFFSS